MTDAKRKVRAREGFIAFATSTLIVAAASAQTAPEREVQDPPLLELVRGALEAGQTLAAGAPSPSKEARLDLDVVYTDGKIWNPATKSHDAVRLRSYQGTRVNPNAPFISPRLEIFPGDTIRINLDNKLPADSSCLTWDNGPNDPHCFNGTNLHTHGLWVNPEGNSDNVLISINPGVEFQYEYNVPFDHPAGTFWYHTHRHGSTALQVSSGMAGAIVIRGNRPPTATKTGDLDTLLKAIPNQPFRERVLVLQQIQYACRDAEGNIKTNPDGTYRCDKGDVGGIEGYDQFGPGSWPASGRYTSINGEVLPFFPGARTGQIERWRVIHGGVRDTINLEFRKLLNPKADMATLTSVAAHDEFISTNCAADPLTQFVVAADGLTTGAVQPLTQTVFQPGYRWDVLVAFPESAPYCVIDAAAPASGSVNQHAPSRQLLGMVRVGAGTKVDGDLGAYVQAQLIRAAQANMPAAVRDQVVRDLRQGMKLARFVPHADIPSDAEMGYQTLVFNIDTSQTPPLFEVDGEPYDPNRIDRTLTLGTIDQWTLKSDFVSHPFHIHVNPFQIVEILDPNGKDVSAPGAVDDYGGSVDTQYPGLKGVWKDTLWVKNPSTKPATQYKLTVRTRYERYIGDFVLHCHILDHEDQGMMQNVRIALPDGAGGASHGHH